MADLQCSEKLRKLQWIQKVRLGVQTQCLVTSVQQRGMGRGEGEDGYWEGEKEGKGRGYPSQVIGWGTMYGHGTRGPGTHTSIEGPGTHTSIEGRHCEK